MTKQAIIGIILVLGWMFLGLFNVLPEDVIVAGLIGLLLGGYLVGSERKEELKKKETKK